MGVRIAHVLSGMASGGIEHWLANLAFESRRSRGESVEFEFITLLAEGGVVADILSANGFRVRHIPFSWRTPAATALSLIRLFNSRRYDAVDCHADYLAGFVNFCAMLAGVPCRIAHVHSTRFAFADPARELRYRAGLLLRVLCLRCSNAVVGCSRDSLWAFLGSPAACRGIPAGAKTRVIHCGVPLDRFRACLDAGPDVLREEAGLPPDSRVLIHVGRHAPEKNLGFLLEVFRMARERIEKLRLVFVGEGEDTAGLRLRARSMGIIDHVRFLGFHANVARLLRTASAFVFPSINEGLPVALVEAQAAGLPCLVSDTVTDECDIVSELVVRLPLSSPDAWVRAIERRLERTPGVTPRAALDLVDGSSFNIEYSYREHMDLYLNANPLRTRRDRADAEK